MYGLTLDHLEDIQNSDVDEATVFGVIDLGALDDDGMGGQVDAPCEGGGADEDLDEALGEVLLDEVAVAAQHTRMMDP